MFSLLGSAIMNILGSDKVVSKGLELIDDAFESDEEKRESKTRAKIDLMKAYAPFKVAQRWIAIMFTLNFIASFWAAIGIWTWGEPGDLNTFLEILAAFNIGWIMFAIVSFYFGGGLAESAGRAFIRKPKDQDGGQ